MFYAMWVALAGAGRVSSSVEVSERSVLYTLGAPNAPPPAAGPLRYFIGPAVGTWRSETLHLSCAKSGQTRGTPRLRTSDESPVRIGLRRDLGAGELQ
eukprot:3830488-Prymnesium_polylepis.1